MEMDADALLDFAPISEYVIPKKSLHGKLVTMLTSSKLEGETEEYRIMGFPAIITDEGGGRYKRNEYMWNLCFIFHASSSLEAFEPVVRKVGRILKAAEVSLCYAFPRMKRVADGSSILVTCHHLVRTILPFRQY
jgi:hypothetical protein